MPTPPASRHSRVRTKLIIEICSDDDDGSGCAQGEDAVTAGGGKGPKLIKPEPVDDVGINTKFKGGQGRALAAVPPRPENPISRLPRTQNPRRQPPALPIAAAGPSRCPQPEVIDISSDDDGNEEEFRGFSSGSRPQKVLHIKGNGQGDRRVKKEPFDDLVYPARSPAAGTRATVGDSAPGRSIVKRKLKTESPDTDRARPRERGGNRDGAGGTRATVGDSAPGSSIVKTKRQTESPDRARPRKRAGHRDGAAGTRATVGDSAPGSSIVKTKRQTESPDRARPRKRGGHCDGRARSRSRSDSRGGRHVGGRGGISSNSGASGTGRRRARTEAGSSRDRNNGKNRVSRRGGEVDRSRLAKKAPVSSEESCGTSGKARRGGPPPIGGVGATVGSRIRSRARQQGRMQPASHTALVVSDGTDEHGVEKDQVVRRSALEHNTDVKEMEKREEVAMDVGGEGSPGDNGAGHVDEQDKYVVGENREDDNGDRHGEQGQAAAAVGVQQEMEGNNELVEEKDDSDEESHSIYHGDDEHGEESGGEDDEFDTAEKAHSHAPSNAMAAGSARSGGNRTRTYRTRIFEGLCLSKNPDETVGEGIVGRTRSKRKCLDKKLLRRGFFGKPVKIDVSESSSESEEEIMPPATPPQGQPSSGEDYNEARRERRRKKGKQKKKPSTSSDEYEVKTRNYRRLEKGQAAMERGKTYGGLRHSAPDGGGNISNAQDDLSFKKYANIAAMKKHQASRAQAAYDELLNSLFADWENHTNAFVPAYAQNGNTLPLKFSFGDENEGDKSDEEEVWREFDDAIEFINTDAHGCEEDDTCNEKNVIPVKAISCENGMHEFIIDDQIGIRCKHCNVVDLEIRYVLPSMGKFSTQRDSIASPELDLFKEMLTLFEKNDLLVSNGNEGAFRIGAHKTGSVWDLIPGVKKDMFLHQRDAFEFAWGKLAGSTEIEEIHELRRAANSDIGGGCVISHAPGTGKTRLAITFVQSYLELFPQCCPVIIAPRAMLATWEQEFKKWKVKLPFHVLNSTEINYSDDKTIEAKIEKDGSFGRRLWANKIDQNYRRLVKLTSWVNGTSIIGVSYSLFRKLANDEGMDGDNVRKLILERPDLLVLDEGHTPRNKKSLIWRVLAQVRTEKRIILSGTLFQNNFEELYNTLYLVRPNDAMLLEKDEGKDWTSLRLSTITEASIDKVRAKLEPIVHYHKGNFLEKSLPGLKETVVILSPLPRQKEIISSMEKTMAMGTLDAEYKISLALVHPSLITCAKLSEKEACLVDRTLLESLRLDPCEGVKTKFVVEVIHQCQVLNERVLVFSQYLEPLSLIMDQLKKRFNWTEDKEILQMSGNVRVKQREAMMAAFNNMKSEAKVMLASTKACCEGITLVGASRVVLLDVVWNPSVGRQAIGRAYRIGQKKIVYTYNLIADGTKEMEKYNRQAKKEYMSKMLFSNEEQPEGGNKSAEATFSDRVLEAMTGREDLKDLFVEIRVENQTNGSIRDAACRRDGEEHNNIKG